MLATGPAARSPARLWSSSAGRSQCRPSPRSTGPFENRATVSISRVSGPTRPTTTRPLEAPRSTAATVTVMGRQRSSRRCGDTGVDRHVQSGGVGEVGAAEHEDGVRDVLGQHLALEDGPLGIERSEVLLLHAVDRRALRAPAAGEDAGALDHAVGVHAVHLDAVLAELGGEQPDLVRLVGLRGPYARLLGPAKTEFFEEM